MNLYRKVIIFIGFIVITISCGGQEQDNKIVLSSQSNDILVIPSGEREDQTINAQKLGQAIASQLDTISRVYNITMTYPDFFVLVSKGHWFDISFTVRTTDGVIYNNIQCEANAEFSELSIIQCESDQVKIEKYLSIPIETILTHPKKIL